MHEQIKRGPGRPRKEPPPEVIAGADDAPEPWQRYRVTHYKVYTSQGRKLAGEFVELPASEGTEYVQMGWMKNADPRLARR